MLFAGACTVFIPAIGIVALARSDPGTGVFLLLGSPLFVTATAVGSLTRLRGRRPGASALQHGHVDDVNEPALLIPYSRALGVAAVLVPVSILLVIAPLAVAFWVDLAVEGAHIDVLVPLVGLSAATGYMAWFLVEIGRKKLSRGVLALTPGGVYHRSWAFRSFFPWHTVVSVSTGQSPESPVITMVVYNNSESWFRRTSRLWKQDEFRLAPHMVVKAAYLSVDPALAYHALRFYHAHPEA
ncbi:MAG TPA: hypothetical protein VIS06_12950, partial [Mycobacteriales bacterium]